MLSIPHMAHDIRGQIITPDDPGYDEARTVFNAAFDRRPAMIVRAADASDVARVVTLARETGTELAVRSGGHSPAGHGVSDGGIVLDLAALRSLRIDPASRTAWAETGLTAGEYTAAAGRHGLATGFGDTSSVGVGGITLAGGIGLLVRKHGMTIDDLLAAEIVTADGSLLRVSAHQHPDLFWALRGGGGNFGVVTRVRLRLHEVGEVVGGMLVLPATPEVIAGFVDAAHAARDELSTIVNVMPAPPLPFLPPEVHGRLVVMAMMVFAGDPAAGERAVAPFRALAEPLADTLRPIEYPEMFPPAAPGDRPVAVARSGFAERLDEREARNIIDWLDASTAPMRIAQLRVLGGAMARVPAGATAFAHRERRLMFAAAAMYADAEERPRHEAWVEGLARELSAGDPAVYAGFLGDEGEERVRAAYPGGAYERLAAAKAQYDPGNLFRLNQNVEPA